MLSDQENMLFLSFTILTLIDIHDCTAGRFVSLFDGASKSPKFLKYRELP